MDGFIATAERGLWHPATQTLILADLHLGFEEALAQRGNLMPAFADAPLRAAWDRLMTRGPRHVVVAGDLFHAATPPEHVRRAALALLHAVPAGCVVAVIPGNHDPAAERLRELFPGTTIRIAPTVTVGGWAVCHGHQLGAGRSAARGLIVGHQHPAVILGNRLESAKMICFAAVGGPWPMIVLPAFSPAPLGSNLLTGRNWIIDAPRPAAALVRIGGIVGDRVLDFGTLDRL